jgi:6-phosphogluconolactonase
MILQKFESSVILEDNLLSLIEVNLRIETKSSNEVIVLLSGGSCSLSLYKRFNEISKVNWSKVKFGLVDEKWFENESNETNFYNISEALGDTILQKATLTPLIYDLKDEINNLSLAKLSNSVFLNKKSIVLLEMGLDGHTASLFPNIVQTENALSEIHPDTSLNIAPFHPKKRLTHNLKSLLNSKKIILNILGNENEDILKRANKELFPISYIINTISSEVEIFWSL